MQFIVHWKAYTLDVRKQSFVLRKVGDKALNSSSDLWFESQRPQRRGGQSRSSPSGTHHGILAHEHNTLNVSLSPEALADFMHLLGADIVDCDNEDTFVSTSRSAMFNRP